MPSQIYQFLPAGSMHFHIQILLLLLFKIHKIHLKSHYSPNLILKYNLFLLLISSCLKLSSPLINSMKLIHLFCKFFWILFNSNGNSHWLLVYIFNRFHKDQKLIFMSLIMSQLHQILLFFKYYLEVSFYYCSFFDKYLVMFND